MQKSIKIYVATFLVSLLSYPALPAQAGFWEVVGDACLAISLCEEQSIVGANIKPEVMTASRNVMPDMTKFQATPVDCGPHSAARVISWLGYGTNSSSIYRLLQLERKMGLVGIPGATELGTTPQYLAELIGKVTKHRENVRIERQVYFSRMKEVLRSGRPVIALVRNGSVSVAGTTAPALHWIVIEGHNDDKREVYYRETKHNEQLTVSYDSFLANTADAGTGDASTWTWKVGSGVANTALREVGVTTSTMIWIDEPVPGTLGEAAHYTPEGGPVFSLGGDDPYVPPKLPEVPPSDKLPVRQSCYKVNANQGWQTFTSEGTFNKITYVSGGWTVDAFNYPAVGPQGHVDPVTAAALAPHNSYKTDQAHPFGAMLLNIRGLGYFATVGGVQLPQPITGDFDIRINDQALADNSGILEVCFTQ